MEISITIHELGLRGCLFFAVVLFFNIFFWSNEINLFEMGTQIWKPVVVLKEFLLTNFWIDIVKFKCNIHLLP